MDDFPSLGELAKNEREQAVRSLAIGYGEVEFSAHEGRVWPQHLDSQVAEFELAHLVARALIVFLVAVESGLPSLGFMGSGEKGQLGRIPIPGHETFQIPPVPCGLLRFNHLSNGSGPSVSCVLRQGENREGSYDAEQ